MSGIDVSGLGADFWSSLLDPAPDEFGQVVDVFASDFLSHGGSDTLLSGPSSLAEGNLDDDHAEITQTDSTLTDDGATVNQVPDAGTEAAVQNVLASLSAYTGMEVAAVSDITDSTPADGGVAQISGMVEYAAWGSLADSDVVDATVDADSDAAAESVAPMAPAAALAINIEDGAGFDGAMGASLVCGGCWYEPVDGSADGERIYYSDGTVDWWFTKPYIIGDVIEEIPYDETLPAEGEDGFPVSEEGDWTYDDEAGEWVYADDWTYYDEADEWVYAGEGDVWGYVDENGDWVSGDEGWDWTYVDEVDDGYYLDEGGDGTYADEGDDLNYITGNTDVVVCWGYPDWFFGEAGDEFDPGGGDAILFEGEDGLVGIDDATLVATIQPMSANSDLLIVV